MFIAFEVLLFLLGIISTPYAQTYCINRMFVPMQALANLYIYLFLVYMLYMYIVSILYYYCAWPALTNARGKCLLHDSNNVRVHTT